MKVPPEGVMGKQVGVLVFQMVKVVATAEPV
jgi:hypothetical protein